jgi:hypothetical protein
MVTQSGARWIRLSVKTLRAHELAKIGDPRRYKGMLRFARAAIAERGNRKTHIQGHRGVRSKRE